jgi:protein O-mannosyl-transferase
METIDTKPSRAGNSVVKLAMLLVVLTVLAYIPALSGGFVWDDDAHVTDSPALRTVHGLATIWTEPGAAHQYYPLVHTSFWIEYHLWGLNPFGYHLVNVILQLLNALLVWGLLEELGIPGAWLAAAVFAIHPVHVESVAWISERKNVLSGAFYLSSLLAYLRFCPLGTDPSWEKRRWGFYWVALALFGCAMLSKTVTCTLPLAILLLTWWKRGRTASRDLWPLLPFFAVGMALGLTTVWVETVYAGARGTEWSFTAFDRVLIAGRALWFYAAKLVWPVDLTFVYPRWNIDAGQLWQWLFPVSAALVMAALWRWRTRIGRGPFAAAAFFIITLGPALGFFNVYPMRYSFVADHFQYLASIGLICAMVAAGRTAIRGRPLRMAAAVAVLASLALLTWRQGRIYRSPETLWRDTLAKNPGCWMAHNNLSAVLTEKGELPESIWHCEQALRFNPNSAEPHNSLGLALARQGKLEDAIGQFEQALQIKPDYAEPNGNLGDVLAQLGRIPEAITHYEEALRLRPDLAAAHCNLGNALMQVNRVPEAVAQYEQALRIRPDDAETHVNLGAALARLGKPDNAFRQYAEALRIEPDCAEAHVNLGNALLTEGRVTEAEAHYEEALRVKPGYAEAQMNLGNALLTQDQVPGAIGHYEEALRIKPDYPQAHDNLGIALARAGRVPEAMKHWEQALTLKPDDVEAHMNLGNALQRQGRVPEAIEQFEEALKLRPDFIPARNALARLRNGQ